MDNTDRQHFLRGYVPELDGMRGVAILAVMCFHFNMRFAKGAFIGVDIFFVLSGFLITALLIKEHDTKERINLKRFYLRRVLRLAPALVLLLVVFLALSVKFLSSARVMSNAIDSLITLFYATNWVRALDIRSPYVLAHTWSLSIEEQFYILWPGILMLLLRYVRSRNVMLAAVSALALLSWGTRVLLVLSGASVDRLYNGFDTRVDMLLVGCALGLAMSSNSINEKLQKRLPGALRFLAPVAALILIYFMHTLYWKSLHLYLWVFFVIEALTVVLILDIFISKRSIVKRILSFRLFVWIGSISYGLYLWHYPVYLVLIEKKLSANSVLMISFLVTFVIATLSYYLMERPILKLKKRL